jgi:hypothetical protein
VPDTTEMLDGAPRAVDPATLPSITVSQSVSDFDHVIAAAAPDILVILAQNLEIENQALLRRDANLLTAVDHGDRLKEMQARLRAAQASGRTVVAHYRFDTVHVSLIVPFGVQTGASLGFQSQGTVTEETYDAGGLLQSQQTSPYSVTFAVRRATGGRWLDVAVLPPGTGS